MFPLGQHSGRAYLAARELVGARSCLRTISSRQMSTGEKAAGADAVATKDDARQDAEETSGFSNPKVRRGAQHRTFLSGNVSGENIFERQNSIKSVRFRDAVENVYLYRVDQSTKLDSAESDESKVSAKLAAQVDMTMPDTSVGLERIADRMIKQSMHNGDFENLKGSGKELPHSYDAPFIDTTTQKLNKVLLTSGLLPEWIDLGKEIKDDSAKWRKKLRAFVLEEQRRAGGAAPKSFSELLALATQNRTRQDRQAAEETHGSLKDEFEGLNKRIQRLNLIVPSMLQQRGLLSEEWEFARVHRPEESTELKSS